MVQRRFGQDVCLKLYARMYTNVYKGNIQIYKQKHDCQGLFFTNQQYQFVGLYTLLKIRYPVWATIRSWGLNLSATGL